MTPLENQYFLSLIEEEFNIKKHLELLYENQKPTGFSFYGSNNIQILIRGNGEEVVFSFKDFNKQEIGFVSLDLYNCENLLNYFHSFYIKEHGFNLKNDFYESFVTNEIPLVKNYLCQYEALECTMDVHEKLYVPNNSSIDHELLIGELLHWSWEEEIASKKTINIIGNIMIPLTLNQTENYWIKLGLYIPNWDIGKYPVIHKSFIFTEYDQNIKDKSVNTIEELIEQTSLNCTSISKTLMYKLLNDKIPDKISKITKLKI